MLKLTLKGAKAGFFDSPAVIKAVDRANRKVLSKFGAFVRTRARTSIRKRKGTSPPGGPPYSHTGILRNLILFAYDIQGKAVVIGPVLSSKPTGAPENLEYGGEAIIPGHKGPAQRAEIKPRPYMGPAMEAERPGLPALWKDAIR